MHIEFGQSFVWPLLSFRDRLIAISLPLALLAGCASSAEETAEQAAIAQQHFEAGDIPAAQAAIGLALSRGSEDPNILLLDARIKTRARDLRGAFEAYRTVLVFQPDNLEALTNTAQLGSILGERQIARDAIGRALALDPANSEALLTLGVLELGEKEFAKALATSERILAANKGDPRGLALKARALTLMGRAPEAIALLRDQIALTGNDVMTASALLETARAQGDSRVMLEQFALIIQAMPESVDLVLDEINTRYKSGDHEGARAAARDFIGKFGAQADAMTRLLDLWREFDPQPIGAGDRAALAAGNVIEPRLAAARYYLERGDLGAAEQLVAGSSDPRAAGLAARVRVRRGDARGAEAAQRILDKDSSNCEALGAVAEWRLARGQTQAAVIPAQIVAAQCLDRIDGYLILARAYQKENRPAAIERVFRDGVDAHPLDTGMSRAFAEWLLSRGRDSSAVGAARRLTTLAPSRESSWRLFADICRRADNSICAGDAARGLARAKTAYQLDPLPGVRAADPLFGRTWR